MRKIYEFWIHNRKKSSEDCRISSTSLDTLKETYGSLKENLFDTLVSDLRINTICGDDYFAETYDEEKDIYYALIERHVTEVI